MGQTLTEIAQTLKDANKKVQLIYAFNGTGKTRLSREFKRLIAPKKYRNRRAGRRKSKNTLLQCFYGRFVLLGQRPECRHQPKTKNTTKQFHRLGTS